MAQLSQSERDIIEEYPLNDTLNRFRDVLREAEEPFMSGSTSRHQTTNGIEKPRLFAAAMVQLLHSLDGSEVAINLSSRTGSQDLASDLLALRRRIQKGDFDYEYYRPLSRLVIKNAPDVDIWTAVLDLINTLSHVTPPGTITPSYDGTPVTRSSASFQGSEQTRAILKDALFGEIQNCTYQGVEGFFEKYFKGKRWSEQANGIYNAIKERHVDGRWTNFPDPPTENDVWNWLSDFQDEFLADSQNIFYRAEKTSDLTGGEPSRQLDIFLKDRSKSTNAKHDWKDILVVGEHKKSDDDRFKDNVLQLSGFVREVFAMQPTRHFVHGFILFGTNLELWVFDRSGPYSSGKFDIHEEPERFIKALAGYAMMSDEELGLDNFLEQENGGLFISVTEDMTGEKKRLQLETKPFVKQRAVVCRGTTCFRTQDQANVVKFSWTSDKRKPEAEQLRLAREKGVKGIAKLLGYQHITSIKEMRKGLTFSEPYSFRLTSPNSSILLSQSPPRVPRSLQAFGNFGIDEVVLGKRKSDEDATIRLKSDEDASTRPRKKSRSKSQRSRLSQKYEAHRSDDDATAKGPRKSRSNSQKSKLDQEQERKALQSISETQVSLYAPEDKPFANRHFGCLVISPAGRALDDFKTIRELLTVLRDAIKAHRSLLCDGGILHRDISENNIIITDPKQADGFMGMLIDLDLAKVLHSERSGARHQTGTMEFMAIQVLQGVAHTYRHDLESFFYVLLWMCARRSWEVVKRYPLDSRRIESRLKKWYFGSLEEVADAKCGHMHEDGFENILAEFPLAFNDVKPLCWKIRDILFGETRRLDIGTPTGPPAKLYDAITAAIDEVLSQ